MLCNDRGPAAGAKEVLVSKISIDIVKVIIRLLLSDYDPNDDELDTDTTTTGSVEEIISLVADGDSQHYEVSWSSRLHFDMIVSYISVGISFHQCSRLLQLSKEISGLGSLQIISIEKVIQVVRFACASDFEIIRSVLKHVWAFSIAMDGGTKVSVPYLDVCLRFILNGNLCNVHLVALPMYESHTGENTFLLITKFLDALCENWRKKLISVSTDGASNIHGRHKGAVTRLDQICLDRFYRMWCGAHQLDLVVQAIFKQM